jgi:hypothetical protein
MTSVAMIYANNSSIDPFVYVVVLKDVTTLQVTQFSRHECKNVLAC